MPYSNLSDLPDAVKKLPTHAQQIFLKTFNSAYAQYNGDEEKAFKIAWAAVNQWRGESMHSDFQRILMRFVKRFGEEGVKRFEIFVANNRLDTSKKYDPKIQFRESFEWIEPLIRYYKEDDQAKYYLVTALTANVSMNNNDYSDPASMLLAGASLSWRPVNLNHDHKQWLPFPRTRIDYSVASEFEVEGTLRVDNQDKWLQNMLDKGEIKHPSIEARPSPNGGFHFTGIALLSVGEELPGDPLTEIVPLVFNESVGKQIYCEMKDGKLVCNCTSAEVKTNMSEKTMNQETIVPLEENKEMRDLRLRCANQEIDLGHKTDEITELKLKLAESEERVKRQNAESTKKIEELTQTKYTQEGKINEQARQNAKFEEDLKRNTEVLQDTIRNTERINQRLTEALNVSTQYKDSLEKLQADYAKMMETQRKLIQENADLTTTLTEARLNEAGWRKEKVEMTESYNKLKRIEKSLYEQMKAHGLYIINPQ